MAMRKARRAVIFARVHWLEMFLAVGLLALVGWYGNVGLGFVPRPTATPAFARTVPTSRPVVTLATPTAPSLDILPMPTTPVTETLLSTRLPFVPLPTPTLTPTPAGRDFDGTVAYRDVLAQTGLGPRPAGSVANKHTRDYIVKTLKESGWDVTTQDFTYLGTNCENIVGKAGQGAVVILGA